MDLQMKHLVCADSERCSADSNLYIMHSIRINLIKGLEDPVSLFHFLQKHFHWKYPHRRICQ